MATDRNVVFYSCKSIAGKPAFNQLKAVKEIKKLTNPADWIVSYDGIDMAVLIDDVGSASKPTHLRFIRIRDESGYTLSPTRTIAQQAVAAGHMPAEFTHLVMWPDGYIGARSSREAPIVRLLSTYFEKTSGQICSVQTLYAANTIQRLKAMNSGGYRKVVATLRNSVATQTALNNNAKWFSGIFNAAKDPDAATVEITISAGHRKKPLSVTTVGELQGLAGMGDLVSKLIVIGEDAQGNRDELNLKEQRITQRLGFPNDLTKNKAAYKAIEAARTRAENTSNGGHPLKQAVNG